MNAAKEWAQLKQAILARALGVKRKSTTAVAKEVACLLHSSLDSCSSVQDPPKVLRDRRSRKKGGAIMTVITAFLVALSFLPFQLSTNPLRPFALIQTGSGSAPWYPTFT